VIREKTITKARQEPRGERAAKEKKDFKNPRKTQRNTTKTGVTKEEKREGKTPQIIMRIGSKGGQRLSLEDLYHHV